MTQEKGFNYISVNTENDEEIVIQAGITEELLEEQEPATREGTGEERLVDHAAESVEAPLDEEVHEASSDTRSRDEDRSSADTAPLVDNYHETTKEDLDIIGPLPKTRLAILAGGLLFVIGFFAYFFLMR